MSTQAEFEARAADDLIKHQRQRLAELEAEIRSMLGATPWGNRSPGVAEVHQMMVPGATGKRWRRLLGIEQK